MEVLTILRGFIPALTILGVTQWFKDPENMEELEREFIEMHKDEDELHHHLPTGFDNEDTKFLIRLCATAQNLEMTKLRQIPKVQDVHIAFKKEVHLHFYLDVIRCSAKYSVTKAPEVDTAFLLKKGDPDPNVGDEIFYMHAKFRYGQIEMSPDAIRARIEAYNSTKKMDAEDVLKRSPTSVIENESLETYDFSRLFGNDDDDDDDGLLESSNANNKRPRRKSKKSQSVVTDDDQSPKAKRLRGENSSTFGRKKVQRDMSDVQEAKSDDYNKGGQPRPSQSDGGGDSANDPKSELESADSLNVNTKLFAKGDEEVAKQ